MGDKSLKLVQKISRLINKTLSSKEHGELGTALRDTYQWKKINKNIYTFFFYLNALTAFE